MHRTMGIVAVLLSAVFVVGCLTLAVEHWIFRPYAAAVRRHAEVRINPASWEIEAHCPRCGKLWQIAAQTGGRGK